jgi:hypothetical protein
MEIRMVAKTLKTDGGFIRALERAARKGPTAEEIGKQRVSFVYGSLDADKKDSITKERIAHALEQDGAR